MQAYFQFETSMLAYGNNPNERLSAICDLCCMRMGAHVREKLESGEMEGDIVSRLAKVSKPPSEFDPADENHIQLVLGMSALNVGNGNAPQMILHATEAQKFHASMVHRLGSFPVVRLRADLFWEAFKCEIPWRDAAVLCAVYSCIGDNCGPVCIRRQWLLARAMGYKQLSHMTAAELKRRADKAKPLTLDQLRHTLDKLESRNLFARVQISPRVTVFSNRMSRTQLGEAALAKFGNPQLTKTNRFSDKQLQERIRIAKKIPVPAKSPQRPHNVPAKSPRVSPLIKNLSIETLNKNSLKETDYRSASGQCFFSDNNQK